MFGMEDELKAALGRAENELELCNDSLISRLEKIKTLEAELTLEREKVRKAREFIFQVPCLCRSNDTKVLEAHPSLMCRRCEALKELGEE